VCIPLVSLLSLVLVFTLEAFLSNDVIALGLTEGGLFCCCNRGLMAPAMAIVAAIVSQSSTVAGDLESVLHM
jgi:hypothetical protein